MQRLIHKNISAGLDYAELSLDTQFLQQFIYDLRLAQCQGTAAAADDQLFTFRFDLNASSVVSITSGL